MIYVVYVILAFGCFLSLLNFYLSFLRYPLYRYRGGSPDDYCWDSGYPMVGSFLVVIMLPFLTHSPLLFWGGVVCAAIDTGGLHWFLLAMIYWGLRGKL